MLATLALACAWHTPHVSRIGLHGASRCYGVRCSSTDEEKRLISRTDNPALVWFDELFDTPSERADRERRAKENMEKWGVILSGADTFDDELPAGAERAPPIEMKKIAGIPADWAIVGGSVITLLAIFVIGSAPADASGLDNLAEEKLAVILVKKVQEREATLGFKLDAEDIRDLENILRNKYCGPSGAFSGEPGGTCAQSPRAEATCFKATGFAPSCTKSYGS